MSEFDFLEEQGVSAALIKAAEEFRQEYGVSEEAKHRRIKPALPFYGKETLEMAMAAVLEQENLLLAGPKATGKNVLAENLAYIFGRPVYNVSFHVNTNSGERRTRRIFRSVDIFLYVLIAPEEIPGLFMW